MNKLDRHDLAWAVRRLPKNLKEIIQDKAWHNKIYVGGGYLRSIVSGEQINDVDVFVQSEKDAELLSFKLSDGDKKKIHKTDNAYTIKGFIPIQIIFRWLFQKPEDVANSFDFTICCGVIHFTEGKWDSYIDERFYVDLASKRLTYRNPVRNEDAGGSLLRVLKYYQKGYRIPLDSLGLVVSRMMSAVHDTTKVSSPYIDLDSIDKGLDNVEEVGRIVTGLLRVVDPSVDPLHEAHLPSSKEIEI